MCREMEGGSIRPHSDHVQGSGPNVYHLLAHPNVISCKDYLFDVGRARHVSQISMCKDEYHKSKVSPLELVSYRFFMLPKEVNHMANALKIGSAMLEVDWS